MNSEGAIMKQELPKYQTHPTCVKCGNSGMFEDEAATTVYRARRKISIWGGGRECSEVLQRTCKRCGYDWDERPLTAEKLCR